MSKTSVMILLYEAQGQLNILLYEAQGQLNISLLHAIKIQLFI
jgi:hypothetical protein